MKLRKLIYADKISTPTDKQSHNLSLTLAAVSVALLTALLILCNLIEQPVLPLYILLGMGAGVAFTISLLFTVFTALRNVTLKNLIAVLLLIASIILLVFVVLQ